MLCYHLSHAHMTASSHRNQSLSSLGGEVELLRNGHRLHSGSCNAIFHEVTITEESQGEYQCRVYFPQNENITEILESGIRNLIVRGKHAQTTCTCTTVIQRNTEYLTIE